MRTMIELPAAVHVGTDKAHRWVFRCSICSGITLRRNRWTLADVHVCKGCAVAHNDVRFAEWEKYLRDVSDAYMENETFDRDLALYLRREAIKAMETHCGTAYPDGDNSPGAEWLYQLHESAEEAWRTGRFGPDSGEDEQSVISELSDSAIEIYTYPRWKIFTDLCMWESEVEMFGVIPEDPTDLTDIIGGIMGEVASVGLNSWLSEKQESAKCEECGEFPCECCEECGEYGECTWCMTHHVSSCVCPDDNHTPED